jgi:hypothetical protein
VKKWADFTPQTSEKMFRVKMPMIFTPFSIPCENARIFHPAARWNGVPGEKPYDFHTVFDSV